MMANTVPLVGDPGVVWYGGTGHRFLTLDGDGPTYGLTCYRCGMAAEPEVAQRAIPDCAGPELGGDHHYVASGRADSAECAYGDAVTSAELWPEPAQCCRA